MTTAIPEDWQPPAWVSLYTRQELRWLCVQLDARNRALRDINVAQAQTIAKLGGTTSEEPRTLRRPTDVDRHHEHYEVDGAPAGDER
jgi:hypothetical protein